MMPGAYSFLVFHMCIRGYVHMNVCPSVRICVCMYVCDPVRLRLRHLYQVEFSSFMVRYPTAGASVYCGHISSFIEERFNNKFIYHTFTRKCVHFACVIHGFQTHITLVECKRCDNRSRG